MNERRRRQVLELRRLQAKEEVIRCGLERGTRRKQKTERQSKAKADM